MKRVKRIEEVTGTGKSQQRKIIGAVFEAEVYRLRLRTGEIVYAFKQGEAFYEIEYRMDLPFEKDDLNIAKGRGIGQVFVSSHPIPAWDGLIRTAMLRYVRHVRNENRYCEDSPGEDIRLGLHPYYLILF